MMCDTALELPLGLFSNGGAATARLQGAGAKLTCAIRLPMRTCAAVAPHMHQIFKMYVSSTVKGRAQATTVLIFDVQR